jgi:flagellar basal-body rod protein FlgF
MGEQPAKVFMDNSAYITLSRQLALFRDMDVTANNIANANTTSYDAEHMLFNSYLTKDVNQRVQNPMAFAYDISTYRNTDTGPIRATGNPLDIAIDGDAYMSVETPLGTRYTRAGNLQIDAGGTLTTAEGYAVLNSNGQRILIPEDAREIRIGSVGNITVNGEELATIGLFKFDNPQLMERLQGALFRSEITPEPANDSVRVVQGALEGANVQPVVELTHMMDVSRSVGNTAKMIEVLYDLQRKTANTWAQQSS